MNEKQLASMAESFDPDNFAETYEDDLVRDAKAARNLEMLQARIDKFEAASKDWRNDLPCQHLCGALLQRAAAWERTAKHEAWKRDNPEAYAKWMETNAKLSAEDGRKRPTD